MKGETKLIARLGTLIQGAEVLTIPGLKVGIITDNTEGLPVKMPKQKRTPHKPLQYKPQLQTQLKRPMQPKQVLSQQQQVTPHKRLPQ